MVPGALPYDQFKKLVDDALAKAPPASDSTAAGAKSTAVGKPAAK
jgi:hypothetical protein